MVKEKNRVFNLSIVFLQTALLIGAIFVMQYFNINRIDAKTMINIAFDLMAMFILIIIHVSCLLGRKNNSSRSFILLLVSVYCCLLFEFGAWVVDGIPGMRLINYSCNIGCNSLMIMNAVLFFDFAYKSLNIKSRTRRISYIAVYIIAGVGVLAELLNYKYGFYYSIDQSNKYIRNQIGSIIGYIPFIFILVLASYHILVMELPRRTKITYLIYILMPSIISVWYMVTGYPPTFFVGTFLSVLIIYVNIYIGIGNEVTQYELENAYHLAELATLRNKQTLSQIRPHFILNTLGSIEELCIVDAKKAEVAVHHFAKYLRTNMDAITETELIPFGDELDHIHHYIWLEKMRFEEDLEYFEDIGVSEFYIPILSIQPLVENAVKHGLMGKDEGSLRVELITRYHNDCIEIIISDDGCGFDTSKVMHDGRSHIGMTYAKSSIEKKLGGTFLVKGEIGKGTVVTISIPRKGK